MIYIQQIVRNFKIILFIFCSSTISAQGEIEVDSLLVTASESIYKDPELSEKIAKLVYEKNTSSDKKSRALFLLSQINYLKTDYKSSLSNLYEIESLNKNSYKQANWSVKINFFLARIYRDLQIQNLTELHFQKANKAFTQISNPDKELYSIYNYENGLSESQKKNYQKSNTFFKNSLSQSETDSQYRYLNYLGLGGNFDFEKKQDSAVFYFSKIPKDNEILYAQSQLGLAEIALSNSDWKTAEPLLLKDYHSDILTQKQRFNLLSQEYLKLGNIEQHEFYKNKTDSLELKINQNQEAAKNFVIQHIEEQENNHSLWKNRVLIVIGLIILLLIPIVYYYFKTKSDYQKYLLVLNEIKPEKVSTAIIQKEKQILIPEKAEQTLLKKLAKFEETEAYLNSKVSLTTLAKQLETNTKYLSEVINNSKEKKFNSYINDLRINYILMKLKTDNKYKNYKVASLAEECGYISHSTFVAAFRAVTGLSPASFINFLKREKSL